MNRLLAERHLPMLDLERYLDIFTFPVRDYYVKAGFDFNREPFEVPAHQFIDHYRSEVLNAPLHSDVSRVLGHLDQKGYVQAILSAMEQDFLQESMSEKNISHFFKVIYGIDNHLGAGKLLAARHLMEELDTDPGRTCIIGDTLHDMEIARELGISCFLVSQGHQSHTRLKESGYPVIHELKELLDIF